MRSAARSSRRGSGKMTVSTSSRQKRPQVPASQPDEAERGAIASARARLRTRQPRFAAKLKMKPDGALDLIGPDHADAAGWAARLQDLFATRGSPFAVVQLNHLLTIARGSSDKPDAVKLNSMLAAVEAIAPTNETEAMLAVQMAATHEAAMLTLARTKRVDQIPQFEAAVNATTKLLRTYTMQLEALSKLRRGGEQTVRVVHVHAGAQAVVGNVSHGGGAHLKSEVQSHEPSPAPSERTALPCDFKADGEAVRSAS